LAMLADVDMLRLAAKTWRQRNEAEPMLLALFTVGTRSTATLLNKLPTVSRLLVLDCTKYMRSAAAACVAGAS
jgi:hypothetical protein